MGEVQGITTTPSDSFQRFVGGIGFVYTRPLKITSDAINYEAVGDKPHNESSIAVRNNRDDWVNDDTVLDFYCDDKTCDLKIAMNSEVPTGLYRDGYLHFSYDQAAQRWSLKAYRQAHWYSDEMVEWKFCSADAVLAHAQSILMYLSMDDDRSVSTEDQILIDSAFDASALLSNLGVSIAWSAGQLRTNVAQYTNDPKCHKGYTSAEAVEDIDSTQMAVPD